MNSPLEQFKLKTIVRIYNSWIDLTVTNSTIFMIIAIGIIMILFNTIINNNLQGVKIVKKNAIIALLEKSYLFIENLVSDLIGKSYNKYIVFLFSLFYFILLNNLIGLIPYSFTTTSHIIVTFFFSFSIIIGATIIGVKKHSLSPNGAGFLSLFVPKGLNEGKIKYLVPFIFFIEILSYFFRIISLSVRLAANLLSGHTLLKIVASFGLKYTWVKPYIFVLIPLVLVSGIFILEIGVSIIQAYVFVLLTTIYLSDVEKLH